MSRTLCPICKKQMNFISRRMKLIFDMYVWTSNYWCIFCKKTWNYCPFLRLWISTDGRVIEGGKK